MSDLADLTRAAGTDVALLLAEQRLSALRQAGFPNDDELLTICRIIARTAPATLLGAAVKLRLLLDPELGLGLGAIETNADDLLSLRQVAELVERLV